MRGLFFSRGQLGLTATLRRTWQMKNEAFIGVLDRCCDEADIRFVHGISVLNSGYRAIVRPNDGHFVFFHFMFQLPVQGLMQAGEIYLACLPAHFEKSSFSWSVRAGNALSASLSNPPQSQSTTGATYKE